MATGDLLIHPQQYPRLMPRNGIPVREDTAYTNEKGEAKSGIRKRAEKTLDKLQTALSGLLEPGESVFYVARCQAPVTLIEQMTTGWYLYVISSAAIVLTNRRLLHFAVDRGGTWRRSLRALHWGDLVKGEVKGWLNKELRLEYRDGRKEKFWGLRRDDAAKIALLLPALRSANPGAITAAGGMVHLCPDCHAGLQAKVYQCRQCGLVFKNESTMLLLSLLVPGGGYFYTRRLFLGSMDFIVEAALLLVVVTSVLEAAGVLGPPEGDPNEPILLAVVSAFILAVEKAVTIYHCQRFVREYMPLKRTRPLSPSIPR